MEVYPKISVIIVTYNAEKDLEQAILSVIGQNYPNLEYIIIDGGSTDNTVAIIKKYEKYLTYWVSERDSGMYEAIQKGFDKCTGEIMAWINSDDIFYEHAFEHVSDIITRYPQVNWMGGCNAHINERGHIVSITPQKNWNKYEYYLLRYKYIQQEGTFWTRLLWEKSGSQINTKAKLAGDLELWLRFFQFEEYYTINIPLGSFKLRSINQKSLEQLEQYTQESNSFIKEHLLKITQIEKKTLKLYHIYQKYINIIPLVRSFPIISNHFRKLEVFNFPPKIQFDRIEQIFKL